MRALDRRPTTVMVTLLGGGESMEAVFEYPNLMVLVVKVEPTLIEHHTQKVPPPSLSAPPLPSPSTVFLLSPLLIPSLQSSTRILTTRISSTRT